EETPKRASSDNVAIQFQVLLSSARPMKEDLPRGVTETQPSRERVVDQHALRQLRADPPAVG
ncbi:MAG: hypothetical protein ACKPKO_12685, partial [Candidatus Fonsibacter sp.]